MTDALLGEILVELRRIRIAVEQPRVVLRAAHAGDDALLAMLASAFGTVAFTASDLTARAAGDPPLRTLLEARKLETVKAIGRYLSELHRRSPAGAYRLVRIGRDGGGAIWSIEVA